MSNKIHEFITMKLAGTINDLSQTKWNKLMFFIDATGACLNDKTYTGFNYIKLPYGPVPQDYRSIIFDMVEKEIVKADTNYGISDSALYIRPFPGKQVDYNFSEYPKLEETINHIIDIFSNWNAVQLSNFSHNFDAWKDTDMYDIIDLNKMKNDSYLNNKFQNSNWASLLLSA